MQLASEMKNKNTRGGRGPSAPRLRPFLVVFAGRWWVVPARPVSCLAWLLARAAVVLLGVWEVGLWLAVFGLLGDAVALVGLGVLGLAVSVVVAWVREWARLK